MQNVERIIAEIAIRIMNEDEELTKSDNYQIYHV
jgi:hypothetical protein